MAKKKYYIQLEAQVYGKDGKKLPGLGAVLHPPYGLVCLTANRYRFKASRKIKVNPATAEALGCVGRAAIWITEHLVQMAEMMNIVTMAFIGPKIVEELLRPSPLFERLRDKSSVPMSGGTGIRMPFTYTKTPRR